MKDKRGFTLVELLGVVVILGIVFGLAVVAYRSTRGEINKTYYSALEESLLIPGGNYFSYNKGMGPSIFGDTAKVKIKDLKDEGYLDTEVLDSEGNSCDLENSYVGAYKDSIDKTNYYVCLVCGNYKTENTACDDDRRRVDYSLGVRANKKESSDVYNISGNSWSNEDITLTFETLNEMDTVILENESGGAVSSCSLTSKNHVKSCTITVTRSGNYQAYAKNNSNSATTRKQDIKILIDKEKPSFDILEKGELKDVVIKEEDKEKLDPSKEPEKINTIEVEIEGEVEDLEKEIENKVYNIKDTGGSGIKSVEYTLEFDEDKDYYKEQGKVTSFNIKKTLKLGIHHFKVRVTDIAGNKTEDKIDYIVYKLIVLPTPELYCNDLTYNSKEQVLLKSELGEGYEIKDEEEERTNEEIREIYADSYDLKVMPLENYRFEIEDIEPKTLTCEIKKKDLTITANTQTISYSGTITKTLDYVTTDGVAEGDTLKDITLVQDIKGYGNNYIIPSNAKIIRNENDFEVTDSYEISYVNGKLIVNPKVTISISGTTEQKGYQSGAQVTVTCESYDNISSFKVTNDKGNTTELKDGLSQSKTITLNTRGENREIKGVCNTSTGGSTSASKKYSIYVYEACSCAEYNSKAAYPCSCKEEYEGCTSCGGWTKIQGYGGEACLGVDEGDLQDICDGDEKITYSNHQSHDTVNGTYWCAHPTKYKCTTKNCKEYNSCESSSFGCKTWSYCWHL